MYKCGVPELEGYIGKKVNDETIMIAKRQGSYARGILRQVSVYFKPDGTITNFSGKVEDIDGITKALNGMLKDES